MSRFFISFAAAILRGLLAKTAALGLEPALAARFPALPHWTCAAIALVLMVIAVELLALLIEWLIEHWGKHE
jgi:hypothetical protein